MGHPAHRNTKRKHTKEDTMNKKLGALAFLGAAAVVLAGCSGTAGGTPSSDASGFDPKGAKDQDITFWLMGGDTPQALRDYLVTEYNKATGGTLTIEEQSW